MGAEDEGAGEGAGVGAEHKPPVSLDRGLLAEPKIPGEFLPFDQCDRSNFGDSGASGNSASSSDEPE